MTLALDCNRCITGIADRHQAKQTTGANHHQANIQRKTGPSTFEESGDPEVADEY